MPLHCEFDPRSLKNNLCVNFAQIDPNVHLLNQVKACRRRLMSGPFVAEFSFLLDSGKDGIEVEALIFNLFNIYLILIDSGKDGIEV